VHKKYDNGLKQMDRTIKIPLTDFIKFILDHNNLLNNIVIFFTLWEGRRYSSLFSNQNGAPSVFNCIPYGDRVGSDIEAVPAFACLIKHLMKTASYFITSLYRVQKGGGDICLCGSMQQKNCSSVVHPYHLTI
jgi:hypothetical protein